MQRVLLATVALIASATVAAVAADLPRAMPAKAPAFVPVAYNWTGFYVGINGGFGWADSHWSGFGANAKPNGPLIGGTVGYNWQALGSPWVFGLEGDADWASIKGGFTNGLCPTGCQTKNNWQATARGRLGYAWDRIMPYVTAGLAAGDIEANQGLFPGASDTRIGWAAGGGVEAALGGNWTAKVEYMRVDLGHLGCGVPSCSLPTRVGFHADEVRAGVNFRF